MKPQIFPKIHKISNMSQNFKICLKSYENQMKLPKEFKKLRGTK